MTGEPGDDQSAVRSPREILDALALESRQSADRFAEPSASARLTVQDFRPLADCLESELSRCYWESEGLQPFIAGAVPYEVHNISWACERAAAVLLARCREAESLPECIEVLELGAGIGLFARGLIDAFEELCREEGLDYCDRLVYYATDGSPRTVRQWSEYGLFDADGTRVVIAQCDALRPAVLTALDGRQVTPQAPLAIVANYLLDSLPASVVRRGSASGDVEELCVRTYLDACDGPEVEKRIGLPVTEIQALTESGSADGARLLGLLPFLEYELAFRPVGGALPCLSEALELHPEGERIMLNHGALACLDASLDLLAPEGFLLLSDLGPTRLEDVAARAYPARFGPSVATCVNFPLIEHHLAARGCVVRKPPGDAERSVHARLVMRRSAPDTMAVFAERFGDDAHTEAEQLAHEAVEHIHAGRHDEAFGCYQRALERCPRDWNLLGQTAQFLTQQMQRPNEAAELARCALDANPHCSAFLWSTLGNCHYLLGETEQAHAAYLNAQRIDPVDAQTQLNLAYTHAHFGELDRALVAIARGLHGDTDNRFEVLLLSKQKEILAQLASRRTEEGERADRRHRGYLSVR